MAVESCKFQNNSAVLLGGALVAAANSKVTFKLLCYLLAMCYCRLMEGCYSLCKQHQMARMLWVPPYQVHNTFRITLGAFSANQIGVTWTLMTHLLTKEHTMLNGTHM